MLFKDVYNCPCIACVFEKSFLFVQNIREFGLRNGYSTPRKTRKRRKNARRRSTKCRKRRKTLVVGRRNAENAEKHSSSVDETLKTPKNTRRRSTKREKRRKTLVVGRRNTENAEKTPVVGRRNAENAEKCSSSVDEIEKMVKISFPPRLKLKKRRKTTFDHGRN